MSTAAIAPVEAILLLLLLAGGFGLVPVLAVIAAVALFGVGSSVT